MFENSVIWNDSLGKVITITVAALAFGRFYTDRAPIFTMKRVKETAKLHIDANME